MVFIQLGFDINDINSAWNQIYDEWKSIASIQGRNKEESIHRIHNLVLNSFIKKKGDF